MRTGELIHLNLTKDDPPHLGFKLEDL